MINACIFDLDGVLVDTAIYHYESWKNIANSLGFSFSMTQNESLKGVSRVHSLDALLKIGNIDIDQDWKNQLLYDKNQIYLSKIKGMNSSHILAGVEQIMNDLSKNNIKMAVGSASKNARTILKKVGLESQFDYIVDGNDVKKAKPDPEVFLKGAKLLKSAPKNVIVFEDSAKGLDAALSGGFWTVGIGNDQHLGHAHKVISSFENLTWSVIKNWFK